MKYSPSKNGFYTEEMHGENIPEDAVEVSVERYAELMNGQAVGKIIQASEDGTPQNVDQGPASEEQLTKQRANLRSAAYREEADPLFFKVQRGEAAHQDWLDKIEEIKARLS